MSFRAALLFGVIGCCVALGQPQQVLDDEQARHATWPDGKLERFIHDTLKDWKTPGLAVAVVDGTSTWTKVCYH